MVVNDDNTEDSPPDEELRPRTSLLPWMVLTSVVALLTGGYALGSTVLTATLAARPAFETALWILDRDPNRTRAKVCALFHVSVGIWHGFPAALVTIGAFIFAKRQLGLAIDLKELNSTLMGLVAAVGISALVGGLATCAALRTGSRIWANPQFESALSEQLLTERNLYSNHAVFVLATSFAIPVLLCLCLFLLVPRPELAMAIGMPTCILLIVVSCLLVGSRIFADSPRAYFLNAPPPPSKNNASLEP